MRNSSLIVTHHHQAAAAAAAAEALAHPSQAINNHLKVLLILFEAAPSDRSK
jgi:hypothetical protein